MPFPFAFAWLNALHAVRHSHTMISWSPVWMMVLLRRWVELLFRWNGIWIWMQRYRFVSALWRWIFPFIQIDAIREFFFKKYSESSKRSNSFASAGHCCLALFLANCECITLDSQLSLLFWVQSNRSPSLAKLSFLHKRRLSLGPLTFVVSFWLHSQPRCNVIVFSTPVFKQVVSFPCASSSWSDSLWCRSPLTVLEQGADMRQGGHQCSDHTPKKHTVVPAPTSRCCRVVLDGLPHLPAASGGRGWPLRTPSSPPGRMHVHSTRIMTRMGMCWYWAPSPKHLGAPKWCHVQRLLGAANIQTNSISYIRRVLTENLTKQKCLLYSPPPKTVGQVTTHTILRWNWNIMIPLWICLPPASLRGKIKIWLNQTYDLRITILGFVSHHEQKPWANIHSIWRAPVALFIGASHHPC